MIVSETNELVINFLSAPWLACDAHCLPWGPWLDKGLLAHLG